MRPRPPQPICNWLTHLRAKAGEGAKNRESLSSFAAWIGMGTMSWQDNVVFLLRYHFWMMITYDNIENFSTSSTNSSSGELNVLPGLQRMTCRIMRSLVPRSSCLLRIPRRYISRGRCFS